MIGDALSGALCVLAALSLIAFRSGGGACGASTRSLLATIAFAAWLLPASDRAHGMLAGGALAAVAFFMFGRKINPADKSAHAQPLHLACAGACAALAYVLGAQPGAFAVISVLALVALIGGHLSIAIGGGDGAPIAIAMTGAASCGLAIAVAISGTHGALIVAAALLAFGCAQSAARVRIARETP